ncbi:MAG TPA: LysM peptidoglycan-binding domain-containing protein [Pyrinomonadaceae bacterium]|jgi:LysM repeat protein|nr:LysM peptidoglycan-binding domain-containing protein [Pyrinomonadaceae bacterium]
MPDNSDHVHIVVTGDTLWAIAKRHNIDLDDLIAANKDTITDPNKIMVGQRVRIPHAIAPAPVMTPPVVAPASESPAPLAEGTDLPLGGMPRTANRSEAEKYEMYSHFFQRYGVKLHALDAGTRALLGLRVRSNTHVAGGAGEYNDRLVVAWRSADGTKRAREFKANTEPSSWYEDTPANRRLGHKIMGSDANRDGSRDLGCLPDGLYNFKRDTSPTYGHILRPVSDLFVIRDIDHDGDFDAADQAKSVHALLNSGKSILFHKGNNNRTGSAGCQTMPRDVFDAFWDTLGPQQRFQYVVSTVA